MGKRGLLLLLGCFVIIKMASAQYSVGQFGNVFAGGTYNITTGLEKDLRQDNFLGRGTRLNAVTQMYGLGYYAVHSSGLVTGASAYVYHIHSNGENGSVNLNIANVFFNLGYCVVNRNGRIIFPYAGIGATGMKFDIFNRDEHRDIIMYKDTISAGARARFQAGGAALDLGISMRLINPFGSSGKKKLSHLVGVDAGTSIFPSFEYWLSHSTNTSVLSLSSPLLIAPYVRVCVGIGSFHHKKDHTPAL